MKENLELVEKLVAKTGLSYTEAKAALEGVDWDILDALIALEAQGRSFGEKTAEYSTKDETTAGENAGGSANNKGNCNQQKSNSGDDFKRTMQSIGTWICKVIDKGNANSIEFNRNGERKFGLPVTVFALLLLFGFWFILPLMVVGLFFGFRYSFAGPDLGKASVNAVMGKATDAAENIKKDFKSATEASRENNSGNQQ